MRTTDDNAEAYPASGVGTVGIDDVTLEQVEGNEQESTPPAVVVGGSVESDNEAYAEEESKAASDEADLAALTPHCIDGMASEFVANMVALGEEDALEASSVVMGSPREKLLHQIVRAMASHQLLGKQTDRQLTVAEHQSVADFFNRMSTVDGVLEQGVTTELDLLLMECFAHCLIGMVQLRCCRPIIDCMERMMNALCCYSAPPASSVTLPHASPTVSGSETTVAEGEDASAAGPVMVVPIAHPVDATDIGGEVEESGCCDDSLGSCESAWKECGSDMAACRDKAACSGVNLGVDEALQEVVSGCCFVGLIAVASTLSVMSGVASADDGLVSGNITAELGRQLTQSSSEVRSQTQFQSVYLVANLLYLMPWWLAKMDARRLTLSKLDDASLHRDMAANLLITGAAVTMMASAAWPLLNVFNLTMVAACVVRLLSDSLRVPALPRRGMANDERQADLCLAELAVAQQAEQERQSRCILNPVVLLGYVGHQWHALRQQMARDGSVLPLILVMGEHTDETQQAVARWRALRAGQSLTADNTPALVSVEEPNHSVAALMKRHWGYGATEAKAAAISLALRDQDREERCQSDGGGLGPV